jgi:GT2 family glycosyltransferase
VQALVRLHGVPLGYVSLPLAAGRITAAALSKTILEQHSWAIIRHLVDDGLAVPPQPDGLRIADLPHIVHPPFSGPWPSVTVAVCTRDRPADLALCLAALSRLDYPHLDLLVVDNAPKTEATAELVRRTFPQVRYIREPRPGLDWARNRAIVEAQGEIIAYTDDDVVVDGGWVRALAQVFAEDPTVMAVTGLVVPYELETVPQLLFEQYGGFGRGFERKWYRVDPLNKEPVASTYGWIGKFGTGANMAYRSNLFHQIGAFDPALDVGTATNGGGDIEMFFRVMKEGHTLVYEPSAIVRHRHRRDYASLRAQIANNGVGFSAYYVRSALAYPDERLAFVQLWLRWLWRWHIRRLVRSLKGTERFPRSLIVAELLGYFIGLSRYHRARPTAAKIARTLGPLVSAEALGEVTPL